ncbi:MAG: SGNH/GDSL hydrolase family protein [Vicinamibacterales bacterium]
MLTRLLLAAALLVTQPNPTRLLFIGNSLTYANELPAMVCALARSAGRQAICESVAKPDYGLEEHWSDGEARRAIARGWDIVVLQQGPSALPESRRLLIAYTRRFDAEIKKAGARTALYMVWPSRTRRGDFPAVSQSYAAAAQDVKGLLLPAGDAWRAAWATDAGLALYGPDGFHPSPIGTYVAALVIYEQIFESPPPAGPVPAAAQPVADVLRRVAHDTVAALTSR